MYQIQYHNIDPIKLNMVMIIVFIFCIQPKHSTLLAQTDYIDTKSVEEFVNRGKEKLAEGSTERAIEYFYNALEINPDYAPAYTTQQCVQITSAMGRFRPV